MLPLQKIIALATFMEMLSSNVQEVKPKMTER
jgi:hypothetical protein